MSSPSSDACSSRTSADDAREQSTKDRRRERNRLAAQKHRLRRNERMSQLEQQVLSLQQEKNSLLSQLDDISQGQPRPALPSPPQSTPASVTGLTLHSDRDADIPRPKRLRTATSADRECDRDHDYAQAGSPNARLSHRYEETIRRMEERILELERWSEDLNGDLADALDSESRLKRELHHTAHTADAHARRLSDAIHAAETERARHLREITDLRDALDAEVASTRTLRDANTRLRESVETAEVTLDLQRVENERLRDRLAEEDGKIANLSTRYEHELADLRHELETIGVENRQLRKLLREQESLEATAVEARQRRKEREELERRRSEEREAAASETIASLTARLSQLEALVATQSRELDETRMERRKMSERVATSGVGVGVGVGVFA